jgi:hypothetical protein
MLAGLSISSISSKGLCKQVCWADGLTHLLVAFPLSIPPTLNLSFPKDYPSAREDPMSSQAKFMHNWDITSMDGALVAVCSSWSLVNCKSIFTHTGKQLLLAHLEGHLIFFNVKRWGLMLRLKSGRDLTPIRALSLLHPMIYKCLGSWENFWFP